MRAVRCARDAFNEFEAWRQRIIANVLATIAPAVPNSLIRVARVALFARGLGVKEMQRRVRAFGDRDEATAVGPNAYRFALNFARDRSVARGRE